MKSRIFLFILSLLFLCLSGAGAQSGGGEFAGGDGSSEAPFLIENKYQLRNLNRYLGENRSGKHFKLVKDIVFEETDFEWGGDFYNAGKGWIPIGENESNSFRGHVFDGGGFFISGLYSSRDMYAGLFGYAYNTVIRNLYLLDCRLNLGGNVYRPHAGMLVAIMNRGRIEHCYCEGEIVSVGWDESCIGGVAGELSGAEMLNSYAKVAISRKEPAEKGTRAYYAGGLAGVIIFGVTIRNCYADVDIKGENVCMGGLVGCCWMWENKGSSVENSYVRGSLRSHFSMGGITSESFISSFRGNCVLLSQMEGKGQKKKKDGLPAVNRVISEGGGKSSHLKNYVNEKMIVKMDFDFKPVNDENGMDGALCAEKPDIAFWKNLGFAFGETPEIPWVFSSAGYPVIYGFENLDILYLRSVPDTVLGKRLKSLYEYFVRNRENCQKNRIAESGSQLSRLNDLYKRDLEAELKVYEEENWALASGIQKELDALNKGAGDKRIDSGLPGTTAKKKEAYLEACSKVKEGAAKWDDTLQLLKERYRDGLVVFQKDCLAAKDMKLAFLAERELKKL